MVNVESERIKMQVFESENGVPIKAWVDNVPFEESAKKQLEQIAVLPFIYKHVAVMPDVHTGIGATVGSVIATTGAVIPAAVGVDLGCGMVSVKTDLKAADLPDSLEKLRWAIEKNVPHGRTDNGGQNDRGAWGNIPQSVEIAWMRLEGKFKQIIQKHPKIKDSNSTRHLGTLGTGNHFIEVCLDENQDVWIMLHSGSRGVGGKIGSYFIELAKEDMRKWFINLPDKDLAYFPEGTEHFTDYVEAVEWAQNFAATNREIMLNLTIAAITKTLNRKIETSIEVINCHHNYIARENHFGKNVIVTRKGAVRARENDFGIIPGSMGTRSYIVRGKGNPLSFHSCSHGAGRRMSRTEAKRTFTIQDHENAVQGVECRRDADVIDETPAAYKDIDQVMNAQTDLVEVVHTLKQVLCVKG